MFVDFEPRLTKRYLMRYDKLTQQLVNWFTFEVK